MEIIFPIIFTVLMGALLFTISQMFRNQEVYEYRNRLIDAIFDDKEHLEENLRIYNSVSYKDMMRKFWKPLNSFYPKDLNNLVCSRFGQPTSVSGKTDRTG